MSSFLKGNFEPKNDVIDKKENEVDTEADFEREAMKRLGGSIAFVSKRRIAWSLEEETNSKKKGRGK